MSNVKAGDLVVICRTTGFTIKNLGRIVTVGRRPYDGEVFEAVNGRRVRFRGDPATCWVIEAPTPLAWRADDGVVYEMPQRPILGSCLRPIRDTDGEDETLSWAGHPISKGVRELRDTVDVLSSKLEELKRLQEQLWSSGRADSPEHAAKAGSGGAV